MSKLNKEVIREINRFEGDDLKSKLMIVAESVAERLNNHKNKLNMVSDLKLLATAIDSNNDIFGSTVLAAPVLREPVERTSVSEALDMLAQAVELLSDAKREFNDFLYDRLKALLLPPSVKIEMTPGTAVSRETCAIVARILASTDLIAAHAADVTANQAELNERLLV